jgi:hypothetical protein
MNLVSCATRYHGIVRTRKAAEQERRTKNTARPCSGWHDRAASVMGGTDCFLTLPLRPGVGTCRWDRLSSVGGNSPRDNPPPRFQLASVATHGARHALNSCGGRRRNKSCFVACRWSATFAAAAHARIAGTTWGTAIFDRGGNGSWRGHRRTHCYGGSQAGGNHGCATGATSAEPILTAVTADRGGCNRNDRQ